MDKIIINADKANGIYKKLFYLHKVTHTPSVPILLGVYGVLYRETLKKYLQKKNNYHGLLWGV